MNFLKGLSKAEQPAALEQFLWKIVCEVPEFIQDGAKDLTQLFCREVAEPSIDRHTARMHADESGIENLFFRNIFGDARGQKKPVVYGGKYFEFFGFSDL